MIHNYGQWQARDYVGVQEGVNNLPPRNHLKTNIIIPGPIKNLILSTYSTVHQLVPNRNQRDNVLIFWFSQKRVTHLPKFIFLELMNWTQLWKHTIRTIDDPCRRGPYIASFNTGGEFKTTPHSRQGARFGNSPSGSHSNQILMERWIKLGKTCQHVCHIKGEKTCWCML